MEDGIWDGKKNDGIIGVWAGRRGVTPLERKIWNYTAPSLIYGWHSHFGLSSRNSRYWIVLKISFKNTIEPFQRIQTKIYRLFGATVHIFGPTNSLNVFIYSYLFAKWSWKLNFELQTINGSFYGQFICICCGWVSCRVAIPKKHVFTSHSQHKHYLLLLSINRYFWSHYKKNDAIVLLITHWKIGTHSQIVCVGMLWVRKLLYTCQMDKSPGFMRYKSTKYICTSAQAVALIFSERTLITRMIKQHVSRHSGDKTRIQLKDALLS